MPTNSEDQVRKDFMYKIVIFGDGGVGKTSLIHRYLTGAFSDRIKVTIGVDFRIKRVVLGNDNVKLQIWDFAGEKRFRALLPNYVRGASAGIFMYDTTRFMSLENLDEWLEVMGKGSKSGKVQFPILMVGGKSDLEAQKSVSLEDAKKAAEQHDIMGVMECSAKTGYHIEEISSTIASAVMERIRELEKS